MKINLLLSFILLFSLNACTSSTNDQVTGGDANSSSADTTKATPIFKDIDVATFKVKMEDPNVVILDVRTPEETAEGKIDGAIEVDFRSDDFADKIDQLDPQKTYLVYCRSGGRSGQACELMKEKGFREFYNLEGGYTAWSEQ